MELTLKQLLDFKNQIYQSLLNVNCSYSKEKLINFPKEFDSYESIGLLFDDASNYWNLILKYYLKNIKERFPLLVKDISLKQVADQFLHQDKSNSKILFYGEYYGFFFAFPCDQGNNKINKIRSIIKGIDTSLDKTKEQLEAKSRIRENNEVKDDDLNFFQKILAPFKFNPINKHQDSDSKYMSVEEIKGKEKRLKEKKKECFDKINIIEDYIARIYSDYHKKICIFKERYENLRLSYKKISLRSIYLFY